MYCCCIETFLQIVRLAEVVSNRGGININVHHLIVMVASTLVISTTTMRVCGVRCYLLHRGYTFEKCMLVCSDPIHNDWHGHVFGYRLYVPTCMLNAIICSCQTSDMPLNWQFQDAFEIETGPVWSQYTMTKHQWECALSPPPSARMHIHIAKQCRGR